MNSFSRPLNLIRILFSTLQLYRQMGGEAEEKLGTLISSDQRNKKFANARDCAELWIHLSYVAQNKVRGEKLGHLDVK
jgi:hypothetical protein